jgi:hypothetical protein
VNGKKSMGRDLGEDEEMPVRTRRWEEDGFPLVRGGRAAVCSADELERAGTRRGESSGGETCGNWGGTRCGPSGAVLSQLFDRIEGERVQVKLSAVRVLFELLGFLLMTSNHNHEGHTSARRGAGSWAQGKTRSSDRVTISGYNVEGPVKGPNFICHDWRRPWNARLAQCGRVG